VGAKDWYLHFGNTFAMWHEASELVAANEWITTSLLPATDAEDRCEFWIGGQLRGSMTKSGNVRVLNLVESAVAPVDAFDFEVSGATWWFTIGSRGAYAPEFKEPSVPVGSWLMGDGVTPWLMEDGSTPWEKES